MTRKQAAAHEKRLKALGVYKPYVSTGEAGFYIESYPLTAIVRDGGCDPEVGPFQTYKISDCSLSRINQDPVLTTGRILIGQEPLAIVANYLVGFHGPAYERAKAQDSK